MLGQDRPSDVFDCAKSLFIQQYELTVHQRLTPAFYMGGLQNEDKSSQWMARFRHIGSDWNRDDVARWSLFRQVPSSLRTALEVPTPQLSMTDLLKKADELHVTLPHDARNTVAPLSRRPVIASNANQQLCWYHNKFVDKSRYCSGTSCPRFLPGLPKGRKTETGNEVGGQ